MLPHSRVILLFAVLLAVHAQALQARAAAPLFEETVVFPSTECNRPNYRIPAIIRSPDGDLLIFAEKRNLGPGDLGDHDLVLKRSRDRGRTWSKEQLLYDGGKLSNVDCTPIIDHTTGTIFLMFLQDKKKFAYLRSDDDGRTWAGPTVIHDSVVKPEWDALGDDQRYGVGPGSGAVQLQLGAKPGRLLVPARHRERVDGGGAPSFSHVFYSDDHGKSWQLGGTISRDGNECQVAELADGRVMISMRDQDNRRRPDKLRQLFATSSDGGETWTEATAQPTIATPQVEACLLRYTTERDHGRNRLLFSNPKSGVREEEHPYGRYNVTVRLSYDEGITWDYGQSVYPGPSSYSNLVVLDDMTIGIVYERGAVGDVKYWDEVAFARFNLEWLTDGKDSINKVAGLPAKNLQVPWDLTKLKQVPNATWGAKTGLVQEVWYDGEEFEGKPTRVFAWYARPDKGDGPFPAMVLIHGGGGKAFAEWATLWAERGYCAIAMDTAGQGPDAQRHADAGPDQSAPAKFPKDSAEFPADKFWTYHAVAAAIKGHSLLASRPEVDAKRVGVTGISWGGYLTCIVAGLDDRFQAAVPVYGCGFLDDNSAWLNLFERMTKDERTRWMAQFDPKVYLPKVKCPILFMNGTNDGAYPLDSYQKSYQLVPGPIDLSVRVRMPHGHPQGWAPVEIGLFIDSILKGGQPLPRLASPRIVADSTTVSFQSPLPVREAQLHYTTDTGIWNKRNWHSVAAKVEDQTIRADLPKLRPLVFYLSLTDDRGALASSAHVELPATGSGRKTSSSD